MDIKENIINKKEYTVVLPSILYEAAKEWCRIYFGQEDSVWVRKVTQISGMRFVHCDTFYFDNEEDAIAFKLRWI